MKKVFIIALVFSLFFSRNIFALSDGNIRIENIPSMNYAVGDTINMTLSFDDLKKIRFLYAVEKNKDDISDCHSYMNDLSIGIDVKDKKDLEVSWQIPDVVSERTPQKWLIICANGSSTEGTPVQAITNPVRIQYNEDNVYSDWSTTFNGSVSFDPLTKKSYKVGETVRATVKLKNARFIGVDAYNSTTSIADQNIIREELASNIQSYTIEWKVPDHLNNSNYKGYLEGVRLRAHVNYWGENVNYGYAWSEDFKILQTSPTNRSPNLTTSINTDTPLPKEEATQHHKMKEECDHLCRNKNIQSDSIRNIHDSITKHIKKRKIYLKELRSMSGKDQSRALVDFIRNKRSK